MAEPSTLPPGYLSEHFQAKEFFRGKGQVVDETKVSPALVNALEELRTLVGDREIIVRSGVRDPEQNKAAGGASDSQHLHGTGADIEIPGMSVDEVYFYVNQVPAFRNGGVGVYPNDGHVHVDVRGTPARWGSVNVVEGGRERKQYLPGVQGVEQALGKNHQQLLNPDHLPHPEEQPQRQSRVTPADTGLDPFKAYTQDTARANYLDETAHTFGKDVAKHAELMMGTAVKHPGVRKDMATAQAIQVDPQSETHVTFFNDLVRDTPLQYLPDVRSKADALDFTATAIASLADPSTFDPLALAEFGAFGAAMKRTGRRTAGGQPSRAPRAASEIPEEKFAEAIDARRKQVMADHEAAKAEMTQLQAEIDAAQASGLSAPEEMVNQFRSVSNRERQLRMQLEPESFERGLAEIDELIQGAQHRAQQATTDVQKTNIAKELDQLGKRRERLSGEIQKARDAMVPVKASKVDEVLKNAKSVIESARMGDEWRQDVARGLVMGQKAVYERANALTTKIDDIRQAMTAQGITSKKMDEQLRILEGKRDNLRKVAEKIGDEKVDIRSILGRDMDEIQGAIETTAEQYVFETTAKRLDQLSKQLLESDVSNVLAREHELMRQLEVAAPMVAKIRRGEVKVGQLERIAGFEGRELPDTLAETLAHAPEGMTPMTFALHWSSLRNSRAKEAYFGALTGTKGRIVGSVEDVYINALLAGAGIPLWNAISMATLTTTKIAERALAARMRGTDVVPGEAGILASSMAEAYMKLFMAGSEGATARAALKGELDRAKGVFNPSLLDDKTAAKLSIPTSHGSIFRASGTQGVALDALAYTVNMPRYLIASTDSIFRYAIKEAWSKSYAYREAYNMAQDQLRRGAKLNKKEIEQYIQAQQERILADPNATVTHRGNRVKIHDLAESEADIIAMMGDLNSKWAKQADQLARSTILGRAVLPFFRPMAITARETVERVGPGAVFFTPIRADLMAGGARATEAKAKLATGAAMAAVGGMLWSTGVLVGNGPIDPDLNKAWVRQGNTPNTLVVGGVKVPYTRLGVVGEIMSYGADMMQAITALPATFDIRMQDPESTGIDMIMEATAKLTALHAAIVANDSLNNDFSNLLRISAHGDGNALERFVEQRASSFAEGTVAGIPIMGVKDIRKFLDEERKSFDSILNRMQRALPFGAKGGQSTARNYWGDKTADFENLNLVQVAMGFTRADAPHAERKNEIAWEMYRGDVSTEAPSRTLNKEGVSTRLSTTEYNALLEQFGRITINGKTIDEALHGLVKSGVWESASGGPRGGKSFLVEKVVQPYREAATNWLYAQSPYASSIQQRVMENIMFQQQGIRGGTPLQRAIPEGGGQGFRIGVTR